MCPHHVPALCLAPLWAGETGSVRAAPEHGAGTSSEFGGSLTITLFLVSLHAALGQRCLYFHHHSKEIGGSERFRSCTEATGQMGQGGAILTQVSERLGPGPGGYPHKELC